MLSKLIDLLSKDKVYLESTLSNRLGVGKKMARQLLHELTRQGYVECIVPVSGSPDCNRCSCHCKSGSLAENRRVIWSLTEKGRELAGII